MNDFGCQYDTDFTKESICRTITIFDPFFHREDVRGLADAGGGKKFGLPPTTVHAMRYHLEVQLLATQSRPKGKNKKKAQSGAIPFCASL